jgi:hypothetical protein
MRAVSFFLSLFNPLFFFAYALFHFLNPICALYISVFLYSIIYFSLNYSILSSFIFHSLYSLSLILCLRSFPRSYQRTSAALSIFLYQVSLFSLSILTLSLYPLVICLSIFLSLLGLSFFLSLLPRMRIGLSVFLCSV